MNKQEIAKKINGLAKAYGGSTIPYQNGLAEAYGTSARLIEEELDEPKAPEVVVPQWFADWIEGKYYLTKGEKISCLWVDFYMSSRNISKDFPKERLDWLRENKELATRAILDGFTVEKEQLYYVRFAGHCILFQAGDEFWVESMDNMDSDCTIKHKFTEKEIKAKGERYWPFAVKVEE